MLRDYLQWGGHVRREYWWKYLQLGRLRRRWDYTGLIKRELRKIGCVGGKR
jgi:hypothetical protein